MNYDRNGNSNASFESIDWEYLGLDIDDEWDNCGGVKDHDLEYIHQFLAEHEHPSSKKNKPAAVPERSSTTAGSFLKSPHNKILAAAAMVLLLVVISVALFGSGDSALKGAWSQLELSDFLPVPPGRVTDLIADTDNYLCVDTYITIDEYSEYVTSCQEAGYILDSDSTSTSFRALNANGYCVRLVYSPGNMNIQLTPPYEMSALQWPGSGLAALVPTPDSTTGYIKTADENEFKAYLGGITAEKYKEFISLCSAAGFNLRANSTGNSYSAYNASGNKLTLVDEGNDTMSITLSRTCHRVLIEAECEKNLLFNKYNVKVYIDSSYAGVIEHGKTVTLAAELSTGTHELLLVSAEDNSVTGSVTLAIEKDQTVKILISCSGRKIKAETV